MTNESTPPADEELEAKLKECDPVVQGYVAALKAENLEFQHQIAKREKINVAAIMVVCVAIIMGVAIVVFGLLSGLSVGGW